MKLQVVTPSGQLAEVFFKHDEPLRDLSKRVEELGVSLDLDGIYSTESITVLDYLSVNDYIPIKHVQCSVPRCGNTKIVNQDKVFFSFPEEPIRCHQWVLYCQKFEEDPGKKRLTLTKNSSICSDHFSPEQFVKNTNTLLKRTAVPSLPESYWKPTPAENANDQEMFTLQKLCFDMESDQDSCIILCRLCAKPCSDFCYIFDEVGSSLKLSDKINLCFPFEVKISDPLPKQICRSCLDKLDALFQLADLSSMSQHKLRDLLSTGNYGSSSLDMCPLCEVGEMIEVVPGNSENDYSGKLLPLENNTQLNMNNIKIEPESECSDEMSNDILLEYKGSYDNESVTSDSLQLQNLDHFEFDNATTIESVMPEKVFPSVDKLDTANAEPNMNLFQSVESAYMSCRICGSEFKEKEELIKHSYDHSCQLFFKCAVCIAFFTSKSDFEEHLSAHKHEKHFCKNCQKLYSSVSEINEHLCKPHTCPVCFMILANEYCFSSHMKVHQDSLYCGICCLVFDSEIKMQKHFLYVHNSRKNHCCEECGKIFKSDASLKYHQRIHQESESAKSFTCEWCGKHFLRRTYLINHLYSFHPYLSIKVKCFTCKICSEAFPNTITAFAHFENVHNSDNLNDSALCVEVSEVQKIFICEYCHRSYSSEYSLHCHRKMHPTEFPYECKHCNAPFKLMDDFRVHQMTHSENNILTEYKSDFKIAKSYLCEYCERCFIDDSKYIEHLSIHYGPKPYQCYHCSSKFASFTDAVQHRFDFKLSAKSAEMYDIGRPYQCHFCNKSFSIEDALTKHIRMHTGEKPFICDQCGKGFSQSSGLYTHLKVHSSDRPYSCSLCPRTFKIKGDRDVHVRKHSGERPYPCEFCGKAFMTQHVYSQHRKIHTGERPYRCDVCGTAFRRSHVLTVHKRIHTGEKPNMCMYCGKRYRQKGDMLKHCRLQHGMLTTKQTL